MSAKFYRFRYFTLAISRNPRVRFFILAGNKGTRFEKVWIDLNAPMVRIRRLLGYLRRPFPYFYSIGLRDCDSGGRVCAWYVDWSATYWRQNALFARWNGAGDGEVIQQVSFLGFVRALRHFRKEGHHA